MFSIRIKQKADGQLQVSRIRAPKHVIEQNPFIKEEIKKEMERALEDHNMRVIKEIGVIDFQ